MITRAPDARRRLLATVLTAGLVVPLALVASVTAQAAPQQFADDFERPDGEVSNGWVAERGQWSLQGGEVVPLSSSDRERVLVQGGVELQSQFDIAADVLVSPSGETSRAWNGIAFHVTELEDGTLDSYVLRIGRSTVDETGRWQFLRMTASDAGPSITLVSEGLADIPLDEFVTVRLGASGDSSAIALSLAAGRSTITEVDLVRDSASPLVGGLVGLYSNNASGVLDNVDVATTAPVDEEPPATGGDGPFADDFTRADGAVANGWVAARGPWELRSAEVVPLSSSDRERLLLQSAVELGSRFDVSADVRIAPEGETSRAWNGIAFNVVEREDASLDSYVLRIGRSTVDETGRWQFLRVTANDAGPSITLVSEGLADFPIGEFVTVRASAMDDSAPLRITLSTGGSTVLETNVLRDTETPLYGGLFGLYSNNSSGVLDNAAIDTSATPAGPPAPPVPLQCVYPELAEYEMPGPDALQVTDVLTVDLTWAGHPVRQQVLTQGSDQYVAYYADDRVMTVAHRTVGTDVWTYQRLDNTLGWDSHNYVTMAIDPGGHLHVSGNLHRDPMIYYRTTVVGDITSLERVTTLVNDDIEQRVTYPVFLQAPDGSMVFSFRDGLSSSGVTYFYRYDDVSRTWSMLLETPLFDGEGQRNAYMQGPTLGEDGYYHLSWVWRDTSDAGTNSRLSYMRSVDLVNWQTLAGDPIPTPVTYGQAGVVVDDAPIYGGLLNGLHKIGFDEAGAPTISFHKYDEQDGSQIYVARAHEESWQVQQVTEWTGKWSFGGGGSIDTLVDVGRTEPLPDGRLALDYGCRGEGRTVILDGETLMPFADIPAPSPYPEEITQVVSDYPEMIVNINPGAGASEAQYVLRAESLPRNRDLPREVWPDAQPLQLFILGNEPDALEPPVEEVESLELLVGSAAAGSAIELELAGFEPGAEVSLELDEAGIRSAELSRAAVLQTVTVGPDGTVVVTLTVPRGTAPGSYVLSAVVDGVVLADAPLTVTAAAAAGGGAGADGAGADAGGGLAATGADAAGIIALAMLLLLLGVAAVVAARRREARLQ